jgi:histidinol-phosphate aminotransferase
MQGIYVRWFNEDKLRDKLRITIGTPEESEHLVKALRLIAGLK